MLKPFLARNWFVLSLPTVVLLAWAVPGFGANGGPLHPEISTRWGVAAIFLAQGLTLPVAALRKGAGKWKLHLLVQTFTFLIFPLLGIALDWSVGRHLPADLRLGFLFLCVLPSTVSTSVVLTGLAGGNTVGAIFNAALSNVLGVFATPIWVAWLMEKGGQSQPMGQVLRDIVLLLLLPLGVGQLLRLGVAAWADRWKKALGNACSGLILFLVFAAFCNSVQQGLWKAHPPGLFVGTALCVGALLLLAITLVGGLARLGKLDRPDRIAATFCAPQKTIASGIPLAKAIFGTHPGLGLILLPILLYHPLQLLVCGAMADRFARAKPPA